MTTGKSKMSSIYNAVSYDALHDMSLAQSLSANSSKFVNSGGQGSVFAWPLCIAPGCNPTPCAVKIYNESSKQPIDKMKMLRDRLCGNRKIVTPALHLIQGAPGNAGYDENAGYVMPFLDNSVPIVSIFPKIAKERNKIDLSVLNSMVLQFRDIMSYCHDKDVVICDFNEYNLMVDTKKYHDVYMIDLDGCMVGKYPATAIMDSIRDRHIGGFNDKSDWFSFAVIMFQLYTGIHPFRGTDPGNLTLDQRMQQGLSVFSPVVKVPRIASDFEAGIPENYREWMKAVFNKRFRGEPPADFTSTAMPVQQLVVVQNSGELKSRVLWAFESRVVNCLSHAGTQIVLTEAGLFIGSDFLPDVAPYSTISVNSGSVITSIVKDDIYHEICFRISNRESIVRSYKSFTVQKCMVTGPFDNSVSNSSPSLNVVLRKSTGLVCGIEAYASDARQVTIREYISGHTSTVVFNGCAFQNLLGTWYCSVLHNGSVYGVQLDELAGYRIVNAERKGMVMFLIAEKSGNMYLYIYRFINEGARIHISKMVRNVTSADINFVVFDHVLVFMEDDQMFVMSSDNKDDNRIKVVDPGDLSGARLSIMDGKVVAFKDNVIYEISLS